MRMRQFAVTRAARQNETGRQFHGVDAAWAKPSPNDTVAGAAIMAKQVITLLTDDLDGGEADRTVEFGLDGVNYTIDLSEKNAGKLRKALDPYLAVATRVGRSGGDSRTARRSAPAVSGRSSRDQNQAIREWANKNGYEVSERGRIPSSIVEAYHNKR
jgi:Lsr2